MYCSLSKGDRLSWLSQTRQMAIRKSDLRSIVLWAPLVSCWDTCYCAAINALPSSFTFSLCVHHFYLATKSGNMDNRVNLIFPITLFFLWKPICHWKMGFVIISNSQFGPFLEQNMVNFNMDLQIAKEFWISRHFLSVLSSPVLSSADRATQAIAQL